MSQNSESISAELEVGNAVEIQEKQDRRMGLISLSALGMAVIEAACAFLILANGIATVLGLSAVTVAGGASLLHSDPIRYPLLTLAALGALLNLFSQANAWRLRNDPAAAWRKRPLTTKQKRRNAMVLALSILTLVIVTAELWAHAQMHARI